MRRRVRAGGLVVQVVVGNHAVFFGFDLSARARRGCLGFGVHREDHTEGEAYWLAGFKTFRSVAPNPGLHATYTTDKHPVQSMWWGDYTAKPAHRYTYKIVPLYGTAKNLTSTDAVSATLEVTTNDPDTGTHGVYFNRGVAASQAYTAKFGATPPNLPPTKRAEAMTWLSRGLQEALCAFITRDASANLAIRAAVYEFTEPTVLAAFAAAKAAGADVQIVYHAKGTQGTLNEAAIHAAKLDRRMLIARTHATIAHNKFIVRCSTAPGGALAAEQVWTGSTNLSQGGIFGHSNVGHAVRDPSVANSYLDYWATLAADPTGKPLKTWVSAHSPFTAADLTKRGVHTLFSPRLELDPLDWYAQGFTTAASSTHITLPFGMDNKHFEPALARIPADDTTLRFAMLNLTDDHQDLWSANHAIQVAVGAAGGPDALARWAKETLTGFNTHVDYLHTKILLLSPLHIAPVTISGSANFSEASTTSNDENMLIITADRDLADIYFTEYTRIFQHFYARWWAAHLDPHGSDTHSYLTEDDSWQSPYWNPHNPKYLERTLYANHVKGNT
jgi:phosphatidylserine/phosphatidylglycerophosphate/cardiolipin synthase-like enzyme